MVFGDEDVVHLPALWDTPVMKVGSRKIPTVRGAEAGVSISPKEPPDPPPLVPGGAWTVTPAVVTLSRASSVIHAPLVLCAMLLVDTCSITEKPVRVQAPRRLPSPLRTQFLLLCSAPHAQPASAQSHPSYPSPSPAPRVSPVDDWTERRLPCSAGSVGDVHSRLQGAEGLFNVFCFQKQGIYILRP